MEQAVIKVEGVGKKFIIGHQRQERYTALRDVIANNVKSVWRKTRELVQNSYRVEGELQEEFWALKDISFEIQQGDRVGIIGRNGAGKSTLLKILSRISEPTEGRITLRGRVASLLEVGTGFHPELTGRENIFLNGAILGMSRVEIRKKFDEIVAFAEVEKFLDTPVKRYSSGMYVRLAFAVAAHLEPEILVVDEVLAVGDAQFQKKCLGKMEDVSKNEGRTVIFVSHQMDAIEALTSKCIYMKSGRLEKVDNTPGIVDVYLHDYRTNAGIRDYRNRSGNGKARLVKLELLKDNNKVYGLKQGDNFQVLLGIENPERLPIDISFVLENHREQPLFCTQLSDNGAETANAAYIEKKINVNVPYLRKGDYVASLAVFRPDKTEFYDVVLHFPVLSIEGIDNDKIFPGDNRWGNLYFPLNWE